MNVRHLIPALCTAVFIVAGSATPAMVEARQFEEYGHNARHYDRDAGYHHRHHRYKPHSKYSWKHRRGYHHAHRHHLKRHFQRKYGHFRPRFGHHGRYRHYGDGVVSFSFRYRQ